MHLACRVPAVGAQMSLYAIVSKLALSLLQTDLTRTVAAYGGELLEMSAAMANVIVAMPGDCYSLASLSVFLGEYKIVVTVASGFSVASQLPC
jgi:hypothetical protein